MSPETGWEESLVIGLAILFEFAVPIASLVTAIVVTLRSEDRSTCQGPRVEPISTSGVDGWPRRWVGWLIGATVLHYVSLPVILLASAVLIFGSSVWVEEGWRIALLFGALGLTTILNVGLLVVYLITAIKGSPSTLGKLAWSFALVTLAWLSYPFALYFLVLRRRRIVRRSVRELPAG